MPLLWNHVTAPAGVSHWQYHLAMFLWTVLAFLYVSLIAQWLTVCARDKLFTEYIDHVIQVAANKQVSAKEVRAMLFIKAEDLLLGLHGDEIQITGKGQTLRAAVRYKADISMPIVNQPVYQMRFDHVLRPPQ
jgi:hypothetical protein